MVPFARVRSAIHQSVARTAEAAWALEKDPKDPKALHDYRRATRRTSAVLDLGWFAMRSTTLAGAQAALSPLARGLGSHRDCDVAPGLLDDAIAASGPLEAALLRSACDSLPRPRGRVRAARHAAGRAARVAPEIARALEKADPTAQGDAYALLVARVRLRLGRALAFGAARQDLHALRLDVKGLREGFDALGQNAEAAECKGVTDLLSHATDAWALARIAAATRAAPLLVARACATEVASLRLFRAAWTSQAWPLLAERLAPSPLAQAA